MTPARFLTVEDIAVELNIPVSTAYRHARTIKKIAAHVAEGERLWHW